MTYTITVANQASPITIQQGSYDNSTSLTLVGKNYPNYGQLLQQDLVNLLQNWSGIQAPNSPKTGQLWWNYGSSILQIYTGGTWKSIGSLTSANSAPSIAVAGDLWFDTANQQLNVYSTSGWLLVGPSYTSAQQKTTSQALTVPAVGGGSPVVLAFYVGSTIIGILSGSATFTPVTNINGFATIQPGYNVNTTIFTGAVPLSGQLVTNAQPNITSVGTLTSLSVGGATTVGGSITPTTSNAYTLGSSVNWFSTAYTQSVQARYADLAEKYLPDGNYHVGTVVMIGGDAEVTQHDGSDMRALGVVSQNPAYMMNNGLEGGTYIALKGRVPVKISGTIRKGQPLRGYFDGKAIGEESMSIYTFAIALSDEIDSLNETVEAAIL